MAGRFKKKYQDIVVGSGLTGVLVGKKLIEMGRDVLILEEKPLVGGRLVQASLSGHGIDHRLRVVPHSDDLVSTIKHLENLLGMSVPYHEETMEIHSFDGLKPTPFVGFGDRAPDYYDVILPYLSEKVIVFEGSPLEWVGEFLQSIEVETRAQVTGLLSEGEQISGVTVNGDKQIMAERVILTGSPRQLLNLLPDDLSSPKFLQKLSKQKFWSSIGVDYIFDIAEAPSRVLFPGTEKDNFPSVGRLFQREDKWVGQFLTFIDGAAESDGEVSGNAVRRIRKQLKKYMPELAAAVTQERVTVSPESHGIMDVTLSADFSIPKIPNLFLLHRSTMAPGVFPFEVSIAAAFLDHEEPRVEPPATV